MKRALLSLMLLASSLSTFASEISHPRLVDLSNSNDPKAALQRDCLIAEMTKSIPELVGIKNANFDLKGAFRADISGGKPSEVRYLALIQGDASTDPTFMLSFELRVSTGSSEEWDLQSDESYVASQMSAQAEMKNLQTGKPILVDLIPCALAFGR